MSNLQRNTANQRLYVYAFQGNDNTTPGAPVTGDAANITCQLRGDGAALAATNDVNPTEVGQGWYEFDLTQAETNFAQILPVPVSSTANVTVVSPAIRTINDLSATQINAEVDQGLADYDGPTNAEMNAAFVIANAAIAAVGADVLTVDTVVDTILVDTGTTLPASIATVDSNVDAILVDTGTTIPAQITALNNVSSADVTAATTTALNTYDPPTRAELTSDKDEILARTGTPITNQALSDIPVYMVDATDGVTPETGLSITVQRSLNGAAFQAATGTVTEIGNGLYQYDATAADMNGAQVVLRFTATGARDYVLSLGTRT